MIGLAVLERVIGMAGKNNEKMSKSKILKDSYILQ
jgi:hypothetical protein